MTDAHGATFEHDRLDDQAYLMEADPSGMLRTVASSGAQVRTAYRAAVEAGLAATGRDARPRAIVVTGMGASGLAGPVLDAVCGNGAPLPVVTVRGYRLPGWVGAADLVVAVSRSGGTEETLAVAAEAVRRGCGILGVGVPDSPLAALVTQGGGRYVPLSGVAGQPRATMWGLVVPPVVAAAGMGLVRADEGLFESVAARLEDIAHRCRPSSESFINPGKTLAAELAGSIPMIWGTSPLAGVAAYRMSCQINESARRPAVWGELPEAGHNQIAALDGPLAGRDIFADPFADGGEAPRLRLVVMRDADEHPRVTRRRVESVRLAEDRGVPVSEIAADEGHPLERLASLVGLADYAALYLALGYGLDPASAPVVGELSARVSQ
ncbi:mannose-6-phosphate isomerase [Microbispora sp. RL4-1S]|uniref:Mannose-6-phosphate isomerase n=1 Tax=Microbispora oryzae TaxID=2806554 RepID=A0A941AL86_9ACTN|nr:SIS domain-containing protein [Microbispora oryzae]MBP2706033.1 mannose-6-phosphate isomerase [Microbispora oryzae]